MRHFLNADDLEAALVAGLFLSAGGSGRRNEKRQRELGQRALEVGPVELVTLDELDPEDVLITATGVGAPGGGKPSITPRDSIDSARVLLDHLEKSPTGVLCGHVPGFNAWLVAAALGISYVDAASNGRGHPTVMMGGMGLASRPEIPITQVGMGGTTADHSRLIVVATGNISLTEKILRQAATLNGGLVMAARGPLTAGFVRENGAPGAISFQLELGRAMLKANGSDRIRATTEFLHGEVLVSGEVVSNTVKYGNGFDLGQMVVRGNGREVRLGVLNEFMTADCLGKRIATFPDMLGSLDPDTGEVVAISELTPGCKVAIIMSHRSNFPVGKGALDPAVFPEVEQAMGLDLQSYL